VEEEIKGLLFGEILGQEIFYNQFDTELVERLMQLGKFSVIRRIVKVINVLCLTITIIVVMGEVVLQNQRVFTTEANMKQCCQHSRQFCSLEASRRSYACT